MDYAASPPKVSLIMTVKNGLPYLRDALEGLALQSSKNFEVVIQDGNSTDGSSELFQSYLQDPRLAGLLQYQREKDASLADAKLKAYRRCRGEIVGSIDADNLIEPRAVETVCGYFQRFPNLAALYGAQNIVNADGSPSSKFYPEAFDIDRVIECSIVPPFGSAYFRRSLVGDLILPAPDLLYCADFELWLKISHLEIRSIPEIIAATRICDSSITCRPETYDQSCKDKVTALERFFARFPSDPFHVAIKKRAQAGVFLWAAESLAFWYVRQGNAPYVLRYLRCAEILCPTSLRLRDLKAKVGLPPNEEIRINL